MIVFLVAFLLLAWLVAWVARRDIGVGPFTVAAMGSAILVAGLLLSPTADGQTFGQGILRVLINGVRQPSGVSEIQCVGSSSACYRDGGVVTIVPGSGGGSGLPDGGPDNALVRADGISTAIQTSQVTVDDSGSISMVASATVDGYDISVLGTTVDNLPLDPLPTSMMSPADASFVQGVYRGSTYTNNGDAGTQIPACVLSMPLRSACRVRVRWQAATVSGLDAGAAVSAASSWCRIYSFYTTSTGIGAAPNAVNCETDHAGVTAGITVQFDGAVLQPTFQGPAATNLRLDCFVDDITCVYNP